MDDIDLVVLPFALLYEDIFSHFLLDLNLHDATIFVSLALYREFKNRSHMEDQSNEILRHFLLE